MKPDDREKHTASSGRVATAAFGVCLVIVAIVILVSVDRPIGVGALVAALVVGGLGVDACVSAVRNTRSMLERIGPLP